MAETVSQYQQGLISSPENGDDLDADVVTGNDNAIRTKHNSHDADPGIHVQSSVLASRPAAGVVGRKWVSVDSGTVRIFYDNGVSWDEASYLRSNFTTVGQSFSVSGTVTATAFAGAATGLTGIPAAQLTGSLPAISGASLTSLSASALTGSLPAISGASLTALSASALTGSLPALNGSALTNLSAANLSGSLPALNGSALTALNASNIASGTLDAARLPSTLTPTTVTASGTITGATVAATTFSAGGLGTMTLGTSDAYLFTHSSSAPDWATLSAPGGSGTSRYLCISIQGVEYRLEAKTAA